LFERGVLVAPGLVGPRKPSLDDTNARPNVTKADGKVDVVLGLLYDSPATIGLDPVAVTKPDAL
jgi:hypothetical protein